MEKKNPRRGNGTGFENHRADEYSRPTLAAADKQSKIPAVSTSSQACNPALAHSDRVQSAIQVASSNVCRSVIALMTGLHTLIN